MKILEIKESEKNIIRNYMDTVKVYGFRVTNDADFCSKYCKIEDMNFAIWGMGHLRKRGMERGGLASTEYWLDRFIDLFTENEDAFWDILDCKEVIVIDKTDNRAFAAALRPVNVNGIMFNEIYVKTMMKTNETRNGVFYVNNTSVVAFDRITGEISDKV